MNQQKSTKNTQNEHKTLKRRAFKNEENLNQKHSNNQRNQLKVLKMNKNTFKNE